MPYDLFVSYSRLDNSDMRVTQLVEQIGTEFAAFAGRPLSTFFDVTEIRGMDDWRRRILSGLRESQLLLACLSPSYLKSTYCEWEFNEYIKHELGHGYFGNGIAPIYFVEVPGWTDKDFEKRSGEWVAELRRRQSIDLRPWFKSGQAALHDASVRERMSELSSQLKERVLRGERVQKSLGNVDNFNPHFFGRLAELAKLRELFSLGRVGVLTAVHGLGGIGKTAIAIQYAHYFADQYGGGCWQLRCEGKSDLGALIRELATPLRITFNQSEQLDPNLQTQRVIAELRALALATAPHHCLLILDNVDQAKLLDPEQARMLPGEEWLHVLATTRLGDNELFRSHQDRAFVSVDELAEPDALEVIESYQPGRRFSSESERASALEIVRLLGGFTLAVESSAVFLGEFAADVSCAAFLTRLRKEGVGGLDSASRQSSEGVRHGEKELFATMSPTLDRMSPPELVVLSYASILLPDGIPIVWLRELAAEGFPELGRDAEPGYPDAWKALLRRLLGLRFIRLTAAADQQGEPVLVSMHRLVQQLVRQRQTRQAEIKENLTRYLNVFLMKVLNRSPGVEQIVNLGTIVDLADPWADVLAGARRAGRDSLQEMTNDTALGRLECDRATVVNLLLSFRAVADFTGVIDLIDRMPEELRQTWIIREQHAFALNRLGKRAMASALLEDALKDFGPSVETYSLLARIYSDQWTEAKQSSRPDAQNLLSHAIDIYVAGFGLDGNDAYFGTKAVNLMEMRKPPDPRQSEMISQVRRIALKTVMQNPGYWEHATMVELAVLARDFDDAKTRLSQVLATAEDSWQLDATAWNIRGIREARAERGESVEAIADIESELEQGGLRLAKRRSS